MLDFHQSSYIPILQQHVMAMNDGPLSTSPTSECLTQLQRWW